MTDEHLDAPAAPLEQTAPQPQTTELRARLLAQFEQWLDQTLAGEPPGRGLPEHLLASESAVAATTPRAPEADLYTLFAALTGLTGEIRLQGRAFKQLTDLLAPLSQTPAMLIQLREAQIESSLSVQAALIDQADDPDASGVAFPQICDVMIDLYDRLQRGLQTCDEGIESLRARSAKRWNRLLRSPVADEKAILAVQAIRDACAITLGRLQAAMQEWGIQRVGTVGEPFDSDRMTAVEIRAAGKAPPGSVLVVNRSGYALNGTLKATAQVTVSAAEM